MPVTSNAPADKNVIVSRPSDVRNYGPASAILLGQLRYWIEKAHNGKSRFIIEKRGYRWLAHSREQLSIETGLSAKQLRTVIESLTRDGVIQIDRTMFQGKAVNLYRLLEGAGTVITEHAQTGGFEGAGSGAFLYPCEIVEETKGDLAPGCADGFSSAETVLGIGGTVQPTPIAETKEKTVGSVQDILAGRMRGKQVQVTPATASKPAELAAVFRSAWSQTYEGHFLPSFTAKQLGQLGLISKACPRGEAGKVIDHAVRHWPEFVAVATATQGGFNAPQLPSVSWLLQYVQSAVHSLKAAGGGSPAGPATVPSKPAPIKKVPKKMPTPDKISDPADEIASADDVAKLLGLD